MPLRSLLVDFNSYFASVEQQERPELRGRPVAIVPVMADTTCCIAASYEAKRLGIKTGTPVGEARRLCPRLAIVQARPAIYVEYHQRLIKAIDACLPVEQILSIDEMTASLRGPWVEPEKALGAARQIKERIYASVGDHLRCSIGIAPNTFLAKVASDMQKPDGLILLEEKDLPHRLLGLVLRDFPGIGKAREARLHACGIRTVEQLCHAPKEALRRAWNGIEGDRMHALLRGEEVGRPPPEKSSISHSRVLEPAYRNDRLAEAVLHRLLQKAAARLRSFGYLAGSMALRIKFLGRGRWGDEMNFNETDDTLEFIRIFELLWARRPRLAPPPLAVGIVLQRLHAIGNVTGSLLRQVRAGSLDRAIDLLNAGFGKNTVYFGGAQDALKAAHAAIAFTHIPQIEKERAPALRMPG